MPRLLSVSLTEPAVLDRTKTVTRRLGWRHAQPGMLLTLVRKVMGRSRRNLDGTRTVEPLVRLAEVRIVSVRRERLEQIPDGDLAREGFPGWDAFDFIAFFCDHTGCTPQTEVTRIEWEYINAH